MGEADNVVAEMKALVRSAEDVQRAVNNLRNPAERTARRFWDLHAGAGSSGGTNQAFLRQGAKACDEAVAALRVAGEELQLAGDRVLEYKREHFTHGGSGSNAGSHFATSDASSHGAARDARIHRGRIQKILVATIVAAGTAASVGTFAGALVAGAPLLVACAAGAVPGLVANAPQFALQRSKDVSELLGLRKSGAKRSEIVAKAIEVGIDSGLDVAGMFYPPLGMWNNFSDLAELTEEILEA